MNLTRDHDRAILLDLIGALIWEYGELSYSAIHQTLGDTPEVRLELQVKPGLSNWPTDEQGNFCPPVEEDRVTVQASVSRIRVTQHGSWAFTTSTACHHVPLNEIPLPQLAAIYANLLTRIELTGGDGHQATSETPCEVENPS